MNYNAQKIETMKKHPYLKDVMTVFPHAIETNVALMEARHMMLKHQVHHLPVIDHHNLRGIISDRDIKLILGPEFDYPDPYSLTVDDVYQPEAYVVDITTMLWEVLATMAERHIGAAIVTKNGHLAGIFTVTDACRAFASVLHGEETPDDAA